MTLRSQAPGIDPDRDGVYSFDELWRAVEKLWRSIDEELVDELIDQLWHLERTACQWKSEERLVDILLERLWARFSRQEMNARQMLVEAFSYGRAFEHLGETGTTGEP